MKPQYFDLTVRDVDAARRFFEASLGWRFVPFAGNPGYYRIEAGAADEPGIDGGIGGTAAFPASGGQPLTIVTIPVADLDATVDKVVRHGGRVVEPRRAIAGIGWYCTCAEPGGLLFGLLQADADAA